MQSLVDEGAIILGKTSLHELAFGITSNNYAFGAVATPYDTSRFAGGSSGGTGSAVAARLAPAGFGTDTGGSVRIPSALNGLAGLRPTILRYSHEGVTPISSTRDVPGPVARTVEDLILLDTVVTGDTSPVPMADLKQVRLGVPIDFMDGIDEETAILATAALQKLKHRGATLVDVDLSGVRTLDEEIGFPIVFYEANRSIKYYLSDYNTNVSLDSLAAQIASPDVKNTFLGAILDGSPGLPSRLDYLSCLDVLLLNLRPQYQDLFQRNKIDAVIYPMTPLPAQPIEGSDDYVWVNGTQVPTFLSFIHNAAPGSTAGIPGITIPFATTEDGLPLGLGLDGPAGSDRHLLSLGLALEKVFGPFPAPEP